MLFAGFCVFRRNEYNESTYLFNVLVLLVAFARAADKR